MSLAKLFKHYNINSQKLKELLERNNIVVDLRFIKQIPEEWLILLTNETGIEKLMSDKIVSVKNVEKIKEVEEKNVDPKTRLQELKKELPKQTEHRLAYIKFSHYEKLYRTT
jgi:hypothetical protein